MTPSEKPSETAGVTAYLRAFAHAELYGGNRTGDWLARHFLPPEWAASLLTPQARDHIRKNVMVPGMYPYITARTAHFDELFREALSDGFGQIVILGAGYDTRALRFGSGNAPARIFELDAPATRQHKAQCLAKAGIHPPGEVRSASVDFRKTDWPSTLETLGFLPSEPAVFFMEGLFMYLEARTVHGVLASIGQSAAAGSRIVFDATARSVVDGTGEQFGAKEVMARASDHGETFLSGIEPDEMRKILEEKGFAVKTHLLPEDLERRFLGDFDPGLMGSISGCFTNVVAEVR